MTAGGRRGPGLFARSSVDEDVAREIEAHLAMREEELIVRGWDAAEARAEALRAFGNREAVADSCSEIVRSHHRAERRARMFEALWQDVRYGMRSIVGSPGFSVVALLTLALGIGANTAIFSVVNGVLLRPLPYDSPEELVWIDEVSQRGGTMSVAWANFVDWRDLSDGVKAMAAFGSGNRAVLGGAEPVEVFGATVTMDFWGAFPQVPAAGRTTLPDDHREGAAAVVVVSRSLARDVLGAADPSSVIGRVIDVGGNGFEVVGVVADFDFPAGAQYWIPVERTAQGNSRTSHNWSVVARLAPGARAEDVERQLDAFQARLMEGVSATDLEYMAREVDIVPLREALVGDVRTPLLILLGAAAFVLLVACTNLASTLLARGTVRGREMAVRSALGGTRGRLLRQLLTESAVLSLLGAGLGVAMAALTLSGLRAVGAQSIPRLENVGIDGWVLAFTLLVAVATALAFGLLPAFRSAEGAQSDALRTGARGNVGARGATWDILVAAEVALALVLLAGSGLLIRSFAAVMAEDAGFDGADVVAAPVTLGATRYPALADHVRFWDDLLDRAEVLPGASAAGLISPRPLTFFPSGRVALDGDPAKFGNAGYVLASSGTFEALDIPLLRGRGFDQQDGPDAPHVVVVSESFAERYWPGEDPIGRLVSSGGMDDYWNVEPVVFGTVVGVVGEVRFRDLERAGEPVVYWHYRQRPFRMRFGATLVTESANGDPSLVAGGVAATIRQADSDVPVRALYMRDLVLDSVAERRFMLFVLGGFASLALVLAGVGIYGVVSYSVARRTREMGVRLALGAAPESVRSLVLRGAMRPVTLGLIVGLAGGLVLSRVVSGLLYGVAPHDPMTFGGVALVLLLTGTLACWVPARRGTRVNPIVAMRAE